MSLAGAFVRFARSYPQITASAITAAVTGGLGAATTGTAGLIFNLLAFSYTLRTGLEVGHRLLSPPMPQLGELVKEARQLEADKSALRDIDDHLSGAALTAKFRALEARDDGAPPTEADVLKLRALEQALAPRGRQA